MQESATQVKTYRRPRRRPAHVRTKTGCLPCRVRKKKCDENPSYCHNCRRLRIECVWPASKSFGVSARGIDLNLGDEHDNEALLSLSRPVPNPKYGELRTSMELSDTNDEAASEQGPLALRSRSRTIFNRERQNSERHTTDPSPSSLRIVTRRESHKSPFFEFMRAVFLPQLIMPTYDHGFIERFASQSLGEAFRFPYFMDALLACSGSEIMISDDFHRNLAEMYYFKALRGLRTHLSGASVSHRPEIQVLRTILLLCMYEKSRINCSDEVLLHLAGAAALVKSLCHQIEAVTPSRMAEEEYSTSLVILEAFIFHATTCIPFHGLSYPSLPINDTFQFAFRILQRHLPGAKEDGFLQFRILGAPPALFAQVRQVALLHRRFEAHYGYDSQQCLELEQDLGQWNDDIFDKCPQYDIGSMQDNTLSASSRSPSNLTHDHPRGSGPRLYVLAARIILRHMITALEQTTQLPYATAPSLHDMIYEAIVLVVGIDISKPFFADYFCWPFFYLGICLSRQHHRDLLMDKINSFPGNGPMGRVAVMLKAKWEC